MQGCFCGLSHSFVALTYTPDEYRKLVCRTEAGRKTKDGTDGCAASLAETLPGLCLFWHPVDFLVFWLWGFWMLCSTYPASAYARGLRSSACHKSPKSMGSARLLQLQRKLWSHAVWVCLVLLKQKALCLLSLFWCQIRPTCSVASVAEHAVLEIGSWPHTAVAAGQSEGAQWHIGRLWIFMDDYGGFDDLIIY